MELLREKFRLFTARGREALEQDGEPFALLEDLLRRNAATAAGDAAVQHALAGAGENIWIQAEADQLELLAVTGELIERARRLRARSAQTSRPSTSRC